MKKVLTLFVIVFIGIMLQTQGVIAGSFNQSNRQFHHSKTRPGKRNTKFIIPALISHMYHQRLDESPLSTMLNKPFTKRTKQESGKRAGTDDNLEHRTIVGDPKRDEHVRNAPKTKCPVDRTKESSDLATQSRGKEGKRSSSNRHNGANLERGGNVIQVSKHFSPLGRNWYGSPSMIWPPVPYPDSYGMPLDQYPNRMSRPLYPGSSAFQQEGLIQHLMGPTRNKFLANSNDEESKDLVSKERKFMVTNITKYVLDFYCPHCGGEISVSKNRNRGGLFGTDQGTISINKGVRDPNESKSQGYTTPFSRESKSE